MDSTKEVILVHGLWYGWWSMAFLSHQLRRAGFVVRSFAYRATNAPLEVHARDLMHFARESEATTLHFVGHSLGG